MAEEPVVSIVMSTYREIADGKEPDGSDSTLGNAIASVVGQSYGRWELEIVADHPPKEVLERIETLVAAYGDPRIHLHNLPAWGGLDFPGYDAKVAGVAAAKGGLLAFFDADNRWHRHLLRRAVAAFDTEPGLDLVYFDTKVKLRQREDLLPLRRAFPLYDLLGPAVGESFVWKKPAWGPEAMQKLGRLNFIDTSDAVMRREAYEASGGLARVDNLDWNLWRAMLRAGRHHFHHVPEVGSTFYTATLQQHQEYAAVALATDFDLPFDLEAYRTRTKGDFVAHHERKHLA